MPLLTAPRVKENEKKNSHSRNKQIGTLIIKKYRCIAAVSKEVGFSGRKLSHLVVSRISRSIKQKYGKQVKIFLEKEDNSTILPGKRDDIKKAKETEKKRVKRLFT